MSRVKAPTGARLAPAERRLSEAHPTGYLALEEGLFSHGSGQEQVHFAQRAGTAFAVGVSGLKQELLTGFLKARRRAGLRRVLLFPLLGADEQQALDAGFSTMRVGQEASLDLKKFGTSGGAMADLRQMLNRAKRRYEIRVSEESPQSLAPEAEGLYRDWLASRVQNQPMSVLVGSPGFERPTGRRYFSARGPSGQLVAFVTVVPGYFGEGSGIDVLARQPTAPAGAMELLLVKIAETLAEDGQSRLSLGCVPLRGVDASDHPLLGRLMKQIHDTRLGNRLFPFQGLGTFKDKFRPDWQDVSMGAWPRLDALALYEGCSLWGLFR